MAHYLQGENHRAGSGTCFSFETLPIAVSLSFSNCHANLHVWENFLSFHCLPLSPHYVSTCVLGAVYCVLGLLSWFVELARIQFRLIDLLVCIHDWYICILLVKDCGCFLLFPLHGNDGVARPHAHIQKDVCSSSLYEMTGQEKGYVHSIWKEKVFGDQVHVFGIHSRCIGQLNQPATKHMLTFVPITD